MTDTVPMDKLVRVYIKIRNRIQKLTQDYEAQVEELEAQKSEIASAMKDQMLALGSTTLRTDAGTIMLGKKTRYYTDDWDSFKHFMVENDAIDLLEKRIAQTNMKTFLEENPGLVPPGLNSNTEYAVSVRKPSK
jgi:hypothetical protein